MEKYIEILDSLLKTKREKKEPTVKEKEGFCSAWLSLVGESGFTIRAEQYLYEGFSFCGANPFYEYLVKTKDQNATLATLFSGKYYGKDSNVTFRLVVHLLALMLNDNAPKNILAPMIKHLPSACINKDKKRLGTAEKTIEKYFLAELCPNVILCPLADLEIKPVFIKEFVAIVSSMIDGIENNSSLKGIVVDNIVKVRKWFADYEAVLSIHSEHESVNVGIAQVAASAEALNSSNNHPAESIKPLKTSYVLPAEETSTDMSAHLVELLCKASKAATAVKSEGVQQKIKIDALTQDLKCEQDKTQQAHQQIADLQDEIIELRKKLFAAESEILELRQAAEQKDSVIVEKNTEIAERMKMAEVLSRDRSKQADETLQRLASKIRVEYRDFMDAFDVPMSCDLGDNLRLQLQNIFDILEKGGMKIK